MFPHPDLDFVVPNLPSLLQEVLWQKLAGLQVLIIAPIINQHMDRVLLGLTFRNQLRDVVLGLSLLNSTLKKAIESLDAPWG